MASDSGQQFALGIVAEIRMGFLSPRRSPERIDAGSEVLNFDDVTTDFRDGHANEIVLYKHL